MSEILSQEEMDALLQALNQPVPEPTEEQEKAITAMFDQLLEARQKEREVMKKMAECKQVEVDKRSESCDNGGNMVDHPSHYNRGSIEVADFVIDQNLPWPLGDAIKYICRAGYKNPDKEVEDLEKAIWYLKRWIRELKRRQSVQAVRDAYEKGRGQFESEHS